MNLIFPTKISQWGWKLKLLIIGANFCHDTEPRFIEILTNAKSQAIENSKKRILKDIKEIAKMSRRGAIRRMNEYVWGIEHSRQQSPTNDDQESHDQQIQFIGLMNPIAIQPPDDANDRDREAQNAFYGPDNEQEGDDDDDPNNLEQQDERHPRN